MRSDAPLAYFWHALGLGEFFTRFTSLRNDAAKLQLELFDGHHTNRKLTAGSLPVYEKGDMSVVANSIFVLSFPLLRKHGNVLICGFPIITRLVRQRSMRASKDLKILLPLKDELLSFGKLVVQ
jgi:hypothetical protein